jgi:hypothetical protein
MEGMDRRSLTRNGSIWRWLMKGRQFWAGIRAKGWGYEVWKSGRKLRGGCGWRRVPGNQNLKNLRLWLIVKGMRIRAGIGESSPSAMIDRIE